MKRACIADTTHITRDGYSFCGKRLGLEWFFVDVVHALASLRQENRVLPCKKCLNKIKEILDDNH
jgi:hypothetical protein